MLLQFFFFKRLSYIYCLNELFKASWYYFKTLNFNWKYKIEITKDLGSVNYGIGSVKNPRRGIINIIIF